MPIRLCACDEALLRSLLRDRDGLPTERQADRRRWVPPAASNVPEYTVSEIAGEVKRMLKGNFVRVLDEITELKRYPSGHLFLAQGRGRETRRHPMEIRRHPVGDEAGERG